MKREIPKDSMTPKERMIAFATGKPMDRIPCTPMVTDQAYALMGYPIRQYYFSAELMAEAHIRAFRLYRGDSMGGGPGLFGIAEAMGTRLAFPDTSVAYVEDPVVKDYSRLEELRQFDPKKSGRLGICLEAVQRMHEAVGDEVFVGCSVGGPFTTAGALRGPETFLKDLRKQPEQAKALLDIATDNIIAFADAICDLGLKPSVADPLSSGTMISDKVFREFAKPYLTRLNQHIAKRKGSGPSMHICGNTAKIWQDMVDTGATSISLDNQVSMTDAREVVGTQVCLAGNIKPSDTMWKGTPADVWEEARECIRTMYDNPKGFILATGCGLPLATPPENVLAMMDAARYYGQMPINRERLEEKVK